MDKDSKNSAKVIFDREIAPTLKGSNSDDTIDKFSKTSNSYFTILGKKLNLKERQFASVVGFKDEFFVETIINNLLIEKNWTEKFYCKKVTANKTSGIKNRSIQIRSEKIDLTIGGDCVIFSKETDKPILIVECKEYIDMVRMKELIGESRVISEHITNSELNYPDLKFWVFAEVEELTRGWSYLLKNSDLKYRIDQIFIVRKGKRRDVNTKPNIDELKRFKYELIKFLRDSLDD